MEFDRLKKIIVKDILGSASGEERRLLDEWRNQSEEHQRLYEKLVSGSFLEKAVSDNNKALRRREWKRLEARIVRRRGRSVRLIRFRVVAAVCILALGIGAVGLWSNSRQDRGGSPLAGSIRVEVLRRLSSWPEGNSSFLIKIPLCVSRLRGYSWSAAGILWISFSP